jgi:hypothetical protein
MQQVPDKDRPEMNVPPGQAAPAGEVYTHDEWNILAETPVKVCRAIIAVSPSGPIGATREVMAMRNAFKETIQGAQAPVLQKLSKNLQQQETVQALWENVGHAFSDRRDAANARQIAITACQQALALLRRIPASEAQSYKEFVYNTAMKVAGAAREGSASQPISDAEQSLLNDVSTALEMPPAH